MLYTCLQDCRCTPDKKIAELADELKSVKEIVIDIRDFLHHHFLPHRLPSVSTCDTPPPLPPPISFASFSRSVPYDSHFQSSLSLCQAPPATSMFGSTLSGSSPFHSQSSVTLAQPPHSLPSDPTSHFHFPQTQPAPVSLSQNLPILQNPFSTNSLAQLYDHPQQVSTNSSFHFSRSLSPLPTSSAPLPYSPIPSPSHPSHTLTTSSPCPPTQLSTPAPQPPLSLEASLNSVISPPALGSTLASSLPPPTVHFQPQLSSQHLTGLVNEVRLKSCSRSNFCSNMVRQLYSVEERKRSNVRGKLGKSKLDPTRLAIVHQTAFQVYPLATGEREETVWSHCIKAIDESCRRLNRAK